MAVMGGYKSPKGSLSEAWQESLGSLPNWQKWYAWRPVIVNGERIWLKHVYRRRFYAGGVHYGYDYGTIFDVLQEGVNG